MNLFSKPLPDGHRYSTSGLSSLNIIGTSKEAVVNLFSKPLQDGRRIDVIPLTFGRARVVIGIPETNTYDDVW